MRSRALCLFLEKARMSYRLPRRFPLLPRKKNSDKSDYGHVLVLAGSKGLTGAAILTSRAALRSGSGLVTLGIPKSLVPFMERPLVEVMKMGLPETRQGSLSPASYARILDFIKKRKISALALGPGLSQNANTACLVRRLVRSVRVPTVLDADGLNSFKGRPEELLGHAPELVLTPHKREFERLFSKKWPERISDRIQLAKKLSRFYHGVLLVKGRPTLIAGGEKVYVNKTGNPALATGGTGDILTGMIASFIGQGLGVFEAACWAAYFHGKAGDVLAKKKGPMGLAAGDLIEILPEVFRRF